MQLVLLFGLVASIALSACSSTTEPFASARQSEARTISGYGLSIDLPAAWEGRIYENDTGLRVVRAASFRLVENDDDVGSKSQKRIGEDGIHIAIWYWADWPPPGQDTAFLAATLPVQIDRSDFGGFEGSVAAATAMRAVTIDGHLLQLVVSFGRTDPTDEAMGDANKVLASFAIS
jgi:hypothetical protein